MPKFSIITPTYNRADGRLQRCMTSVLAQVYGDYEHIIVDDGSVDDTEAVCADYPLHRYVRIEHGGRVVARNAGMAAAEGEWFCHLDSDDGLDMMYLETLAYHIDQRPDVKLWTVGVIQHGMLKDETKHGICPIWTKLRPAWIPPLNEDGDYPVHPHFPSGKVGTGQFVYHRECYEKVGPLPPWKGHLEAADGVDDWLGYETGYDSRTRWIGNPHGDDYCYHRKLTMYYQAHKIDACLYVHYVR